MFSYDNPRSINYHIENYDFGADAGGATYYFAGPAGHKGRLKTISAATTEAFACTTTAASVQVGTQANPDAYGKLNIADTTAQYAVYNNEDDTDAIIAPAMPADTLFVIYLTDSVDDSSDTGKASVDVVIDWFK